MLESIVEIVGDYLAVIFGEKAKESKVLAVISWITILIGIIAVIYFFVKT